MEPFFSSGESITLRDVYAGRIKAAVSFITIEHTDERFVGWLPAGGEFALPLDSEGRPVKDVMRAHELAVLKWAMPDSPGQLVVAEADSGFTVILRYFGEEWTMPEWYINLQEPLRRTDIGFDSTDYVLDLLVSSDGVRWRWKDEEEFEAAVQQGFVTPDRAAAIRADGSRARELAGAGAAPFDAEFLGFRPDPAWLPPRLNPRWRELPS